MDAQDVDGAEVETPVEVPAETTWAPALDLHALNNYLAALCGCAWLLKHIPIQEGGLELLDRILLVIDKLEVMTEPYDVQGAGGPPFRIESDTLRIDRGGVLHPILHGCHRSCPEMPGGREESR